MKFYIGRLAISTANKTMFTNRVNLVCQSFLFQLIKNLSHLYLLQVTLYKVILSAT